MPIRSLARAVALLVLFSAILEAQSGRAPQGSCPLAVGAGQSESFALVLSGGGARGLAHIGVLRVLDSLGVSPGLVVGTSMGALVGALYAGGVSGRQLDSLARTLPFEALFRRYAPITLLTAGDFAAPISVLAPAFVLEMRGGAVRLQSPVAREERINALFNQLLLRPNLAAGGDFNRLPRRFRAVATDMQQRSPVVLRDGDLAEAVRASIAIPVVLTPLRRNGRLLVDGGLSANEPTRIARAAGASRVLSVDVGASLADSLGEVTTASMLAYLIDELFTQPPDSLGLGDLRIRPEVRRFGPLEFVHTAVGPLIDAGYRAAAVALRGCRRSPPSSAMLLTANEAEAGFLARRLARLAEEGVYETVWLRPRRDGASVASSVIADARFSELRFAPVATLAPERIAYGGFSYDGHVGAHAWIAIQNLAPAGGRLAVRGVLGVGEWRQRVLFTASGVRRHALPRARDGAARDGAEQIALPDPRANVPPWSTLTRRLPRPEASLTASHEIVRLYDDRGRSLDRPSSRDLFAVAGIVSTPIPRWHLVLGPAVHASWTHSAAFPADLQESAVGLLFRGARMFSLPATGPDLSTIPTVAAEAALLDGYRRFDAHANLQFQVGPLMLRPRAAAGWGDALPLTALFALGGPHGFPGLRMGERRGDQVVFGSLALLRRVRGPLYASLEAGRGRTALARVRHPEVFSTAASGWVSGAELGLTGDTPFGSFLIGYGIATGGGSVFKIRLGN